MNIINDYNEIKHLENEEELKTAWAEYINERTQNLEDYIKLKPNYIKNVNIFKQDSNFVEIIIMYLNNIFSLNCSYIGSFNLEANIDNFKNIIQKKTNNKIFFLKYLFNHFNNSYYKDNIKRTIDNEQYNSAFLQLLLNENPYTLLHYNIVFYNITKALCKKILITDKDIYVKGCAFLFGSSNMNGNEIIVSNYRINNLDNYTDLLIKLLIHEFGHSLDIEHCNKRKCVFNGIGCLEDLLYIPIYPCLECCSKIAFATNKSLLEQINCMLKIFVNDIKFIMCKNILENKNV